MKIKVLAAWAAIIAFLGFDSAKENELTSEDVAKLNDELASRAQTIAALTTERDNLKSENGTLTTAKTKAESDLAAANTKIGTLETANTSLTSENSTLKANAGAKTAVAATAADPDSKESADADVKFCATHSVAENVAYLRSKRKSKND